LSAKNGESLTPLGENLENVPPSLRHHIEDAPDIVVWDGLMKKIAHAVDEDSFRVTPSQGQGELVRLECQ
jgi:hypothetical protein